MAQVSGSREVYPAGTPLPPFKLDILQSSQTPVEHDGSFFDRQRVPRRYLETPVDEFTGVPLAIFPSENLPPIPPKKENHERDGDWHHPFHPRAGLVNGSVAQMALRGSRVQWVRYDEHHDGVGYHRTFAGPPIPTTEFDLFKTVVFSCAGFVGERALLFAPDGTYEERALNRSARKRLVAPGILRIDAYRKVADFLLDYGARQSVDLVSPSMIDELMNSQDAEARKRVAGEFLAAASEEMTSDIQQAFRQAKSERWLPDRRTANAANYVRNLLTIKRDGKRSVDRMTLKRLTDVLQAA